MSPTETSKHENLLEHPDEAFAFYRKEGIAIVVCEQKHMGSRAVVVLCKDEAVSQKRFGVVQASLGTVYTRTGRRFFTDEALEHQFLARLQSAVESSGLWEELATDWLCLDCELMPWSAKAQELLQKQYAPVGNAGVHALRAESELITKASLHVPGLESLSAQTAKRLSAVEHYTTAYRQYCWPVGSLADLKLAPFHILASEGAVHTDKPHTWHMETIAKLCGVDPEILFATPFKIVDLHDEASTADAVAWWTEMTAHGREGMVVKPLNFISEGRRGITQPAIKCRGAEYLRIIYGPEYRPTYEGFDLGFNLSASDMIRTIWAYLYGLLEVARVSPTNHPGLLILDEPRQQQANRMSFALFAKRAAASRQARQQVIFLTSEDEDTVQEMLGSVEHKYINFAGQMKLIQPIASEVDAAS
jgi:protein phosphatase